MLREKRKPIPGDLAIMYLTGVANILRNFANIHAKSKRWHTAPQPEDAIESYFNDDEPLKLAADVLESVASGGSPFRRDFGGLIDGRARAKLQIMAVEAVRVAIMEANYSAYKAGQEEITLGQLLFPDHGYGSVISRTEAYRRAGKMLEVDTQVIARQFRAYEQRLQRKLNWFAEGKRGPRVKG